MEKRETDDGGGHMSGRNLLRPGEVAEIANVHPETVRRWVREGEISAEYTPGGHARIPASELIRLGLLSSPQKALLYVRVSDQDEGLLPAALQHLVAFAMEHEYQVIEIVQEVADGDLDRESLRKIRRAFRQGQCEYGTIIVERNDRLLLTGADEFARWIAPIEIVEAGVHSEAARSAYNREVLLDLYWPLADTLAMEGQPPEDIQHAVAEGLELIAEKLHL
jgi:excisionase family DNA binding protein